MGIARHHAEWLSLLEIDGPFLSMPVLLRAFPQGLYADEPELARELRLAYEEWLDNQGGLQPDPAIHRAWVLWVLRRVLGMPDAVLAGAAGGADERLEALAVAVAEQHETLRPDFAVLDPEAPVGKAEEDSAPRARLLLMLVPPGQSLERPLAGRHWKASPATRMMTLLHARGLRLGMVTNGERWMLVDAPRGGTTAFVSWYARLWLDERLTQRALRSLLGADRFFGLPAAETPEGLLAASAGQQQEVTDQLGYQVRQAVEILVDAIDGADQDGGGTLLADMAMPELYQAAVTVMMRLVFLFAAEERGLLLLGDPLYDEHYAVSTLAARLREAADMGGEELLGRRYDAWSRLLATFRAVHGGVSHDRLHLPAYGGDLFDPDRFPFLEGRPALSRWRESPARPLPIDNRTVLHLLEALQLLRVPVPGGGGGAEMQRLSFRALGIEQIGHVYEGLLDHTAVRAQDVVLGLAGTKAKEPEIAVTRLEEAGGKGDEELLRLLKEETGRSEKALTKALKGYAVNPPSQSRLLEACGNDPELLYRITPYAGLIREDSYGSPYVVRPKSAYVTAGTDRRATGAHYTPRSLTEPIVQRTLEPVVYRGPAEGLPREDWRLKGAAELLELKVCDMAMGSGAFLVQACRYLGERLMEAWEGAERGGGLEAAPIIDITPEGAPAGEGDQVVPRDPVDREMTALRLVASRCLYGVDKNPLAVEMAKLSLWLLTLAKGQRFTFLDHALKCGDSLVGLSRAQIERFSWDPPEQAGQMLLASGFIAERLKRAEELRRWVREAGSEVREEQLKQQNRAAEQALEDVRLIGDVVIAAFFAGDKPKAREGKRLAAWEKVRGWLGGDANAAGGHAELVERAAALRAGAKGVAPFHWEVEFPEVFGRAGAGSAAGVGAGPGFDGIVGNPPFAGKNTMASGNHLNYPDWLKTAHDGSHGNADLVAHFFRRAYSLLAPGGCFGLIATNTIAQGDTRATGLAWIRGQAGSLYSANRRVPWPGQAAVIVSVVHARHGSYRGSHLLDDQPVDRITAFLFPTGSDDDPHRLAANAGKSFIGSYILGMGFTFDDTDKKGKASPIAEMRRLIAENPANQEVIFPYIGGEEVNTSPTHAHHRSVINFGERGEEECRRRWPEVMGIVEERVRPERMKLSEDNQDGRNRKKHWWRWGRYTPALFEAIRGMGRVLVISRVGNAFAICLMESSCVFSERLVVFPLETFASLANLQSMIHESWARNFSSTLKDDLMYAPSDCFETFPFPPAWETDPALESAGEAYYTYRAQLMVANDEGLTKTHNRFHDPDETSPQIHRLRELHAAMDRAVLDAYGWGDVPTDCQFLLDYEVTEEASGRKKPWRYRWPDAVRDDVLGRLLALNQARYEEEVARGLHGGAGGKAGGRAGAGRKGKGTGAAAAEDAGGGVQGRLL